MCPCAYLSYLHRLCPLAASLTRALFGIQVQSSLPACVWLGIPAPSCPSLSSLNNLGTKGDQRILSLRSIYTHWQSRTFGKAAKETATVVSLPPRASETKEKRCYYSPSPALPLCTQPLQVFDSSLPLPHLTTPATYFSCFFYPPYQLLTAVDLATAGTRSDHHPLTGHKVEGRWPWRLQV